MYVKLLELKSSVEDKVNKVYLFILYKIHLAAQYRVFPTYFIYWIAAYPVDNAIHLLSCLPCLLSSLTFCLCLT